MAHSTSNAYTHRNVFRRQIKRFILSVSELGVLVVGFFLSFTFANFLAHIFTTSENWLASVTLLAGVAATIFGFVVVRRKTRRWKFEYDVVSWTISQSARKLHPTRASYKRMAKRVLVWVPSAIAAGVLLFFPVATHVVHPNSHYLRHYLVPIPWTFAVFPSPGGTAPYSTVVAFGGSNGQLGFAPFWDHRRLPSVLAVGSIKGDADTFEFNHKW
jgi:MFS family permease